MSHCSEKVISLEIDELNIALAGNPNSGKSVIFYELTGVYAQVSNYPGTTLSVEQGQFEEIAIIDTPGVYGVSSFSIEEQITKKILSKSDKVINVVNALHLDRELFLTLQLIDMGIPMIVVLNFMDEAEKAGIIIDVDKLSEKLGVKVIPCIAIKGKGIDEIKSNIRNIQKSTVNHSYNVEDPELLKIQNKHDFILAIEGDKEILEKYHINNGKINLDIYQQRRERVNNILTQVYQNVGSKNRLKTKLSSLLVHPILGFGFLAIILYIAYQIVGVFVAQTVVEFTEDTLMQLYFVPFIQDIVNLASFPEWLNQFIAGEFGIITMPVSYVFGLLLPLALSFYLLLSLMEDTGYLPRLAFLIDKWLMKLGLNGKAVIPLILGFGCVTMATITTRMLDTQRERTIASTLLNFSIPCSAQLTVITALAATAGGYFILAFAAVIFTFFVLLGTILNKSMPDKSSSLIITLPTLQLPRIKNIFLKTYIRTKSFMSEAIVWFFIGAVLISFLQVTGTIVFLQNAISPIVTSWLGLPQEASIGFIMGIIRRDFGAAGFYSLGLEPLQLLVALVSITLFVPCIAAILILYKERGSKIATMIWVGTMVVAFIIGGLINKIGQLVNVFTM